MVNDKMISLADQLGQRLLSRHWHMSCAESCTGGGIGFAITSIPGSSGWFEQGYITYSNAAKTALVGVSNTLLEHHGAVSSEVVEAMAQGAAARSGAQLAIAVSGIAGPDGGSAAKPVGTVWFGLALPEQVICCQQCFAGDRQQVRQQAIEFALQYCLEHL